MGTRVPRGLDRDRFSTFGIVVRAIWPIKAALNLAQRAGCTERHANLLITGKRKPNARAMHALNAAILDD